MTPVEFRRQVFREPAQWEHGLSFKLRRLDGGGLALLSRPAFAEWVSQADAARGVGHVAVDPCGRIFWVHSRDCHLYRFDPTNELIESIMPLADCIEGNSHVFGRLLFAWERLWILDRSGMRFLVLRPDTFQILSIIPLLNPVDAAVGRRQLVVLDRGGLHMFDREGRRLRSVPLPWLQSPIAVGADREDRIYVLDGQARGFLRFTAEGVFDAEVGDLAEAGRGFAPRLLVVDSDGNLFVSDGSSESHEFAADGGYIGGTGAVSPLSAMLGLTRGLSGELYVGSPEGIARFSRTTGVAGNKGQFYTRTLDNGSERRDGWHRLDLLAELDAGGALDVYYASSPDAALASAVAAIMERRTSVPDKVKSLEAVLGDRWNGPHSLRTPATAGQPTETNGVDPFARRMSHSVLFRADTDRYLWLKLELAGLAPRASASVREMRVYYPRLSYLRYLPAIYQQDPVSRDFVERFLSIFETVFSGLEGTIERIPEIFDPTLTPHAFLDWLGQWLDLGLEEDWPPRVKRALVVNASRLYRTKGTPGGLAAFIEIVTGRRPVIREAFASERPFILGEGSRLGSESYVFRRAVANLPRHERTVLGDAVVLGTTRLRDSSRTAVHPLRAIAHRFTVLLPLSPREFQRHERGLHRIIHDSSPAHLSYELRLVAGGRLGSGGMVGVGLRVTDPQPLLLGYSSLGQSVCARRVRYGPEVGIDTSLAGPVPGSGDVFASDDGEQ
jgi:phage tail-like protein